MCFKNSSVGSLKQFYYIPDLVPLPSQAWLRKFIFLTDLFRIAFFVINSLRYFEIQLEAGALLSVKFTFTNLCI